GEKGDKGDTGAAGKDGKNGENGKDGKDGKDGTNGVDGKDGRDGIGVSKSELNSRGELLLTYTDGRVQNVGIVTGAQGEKGDKG
ncbi:MAG TPA: hypothetical protein DEF10_08770, partial [Ruminococcaceae bacterium]|nr:hypothetical protein [Oscillospiraceae bacterium]